MAPPAAVEGIPNLFISTTEKGVQDHNSLLETYKFLETILHEKQAVKPVMIMTDGHTSRFNFNILSYLQDVDNHMFLGPPDTTGLTQLLDQINHNLHDLYRKKKKDMFSAHHTIDRSSFMSILSKIWDKWASKKSIIAAAKRVGISKEGLNVNWMQQQKFEKAASVIQTPEPSKSSKIVDSPAERKGSSAYWKAKYELAIEKLTENEIDLEAAGVLTTEKIKPKEKKEKVRVTQVWGSMTGKNVLSMVKDIEEKKSQAKERKEVSQKKKEEEKVKFLKCKDNCVCEGGECIAKGLKQCTVCGEILRSQCTKAKCKNDDGQKPLMLKVAGQKQSNVSLKEKGEPSKGKSKAAKRKLILESDEESDFTEDSDVSDEEERYEEIRSESEVEEDDFNAGDCVKVVEEPFKGHYAIVQGKSYGDEWEIVYFERKNKGYYVIKENDLDSRSPSELMKVKETFDEKERYYFDS